MGHLNSFSASGVRNLNEKFPKIQMPGGLPGGDASFLRLNNYIKNLPELLHLKSPIKIQQQNLRPTLNSLKI